MTPVALLEWLVKEDESLLGECHGTALDELLRRGYATIREAPRGIDPNYGRVVVTDRGHAFLAQLRQAEQ